MKQFTLSHVVLYAKGWYTKTEDIWADLTKILEYDDYMPENNNDIMSIMVSEFEKATLNANWNGLFNTIVGINTSMKNNNYEYNRATIDYILGSLRFIDNTCWIPKVPKYNKNNLKPKHIELKSVIEHFKNKQLCHH